MAARRNGRRIRWYAGGAGAALVLAALACAATAPAWRGLARRAALERAGDLHFQRGENAEAEAAWRAVLSQRPDSVSTRNKLAVLCMKEGRYDEAARLLDEGIRARPKAVSFRFNRALLCHMRGDLGGALAFLEQVERMSPGHGDVHFFKGVIYEKLGRADLAEREFIKQLNVDPATPAAWARVLKYPATTAAGGGKDISGRSR